tara:strand:- start:734 stop:1063 length:330 start_codon:yes stop_codon:yes gene_type:complete
MNMKNALLTVLVALSTSVFAQRIPFEFEGETFERLSENFIVFTENDGHIYSKISGLKVLEVRKFKKQKLVSETRVVDGVTIVTVINNKTKGNPLIFKYSHCIIGKKKEA